MKHRLENPEESSPPKRQKMEEIYFEENLVRLIISYLHNTFRFYCTAKVNKLWRMVSLQSIKIIGFTNPMHVLYSHFGAHKKLDYKIDFWNLSLSSVKHLLKRLPQLQSLHFGFLIRDFRDGIDTSSLITDENWIEIIHELQIQTHLKHLCLNHCNFEGFYHEHFFQQLFHALPNMEYLDLTNLKLYHFETITNLKNLKALCFPKSISGVEAISLFSNPLHQLQYLRMEQIFLVFHPENRINLVHFFNQMPQLKSLHLHSVTVPFQFFDLIKQSAFYNQLTYLSLVNVKTSNFSVSSKVTLNMQQFVKENENNAWPKLKILHLGYCPNVLEEELRHILILLPHIQVEIQMTCFDIEQRFDCYCTCAYSDEYEDELFKTRAVNQNPNYKTNLWEECEQVCVTNGIGKLCADFSPLTHQDMKNRYRIELLALQYPQLKLLNSRFHTKKFVEKTNNSIALHNTIYADYIRLRDCMKELHDEDAHFELENIFLE